MSLRRFPWKAPRITDNSYKLFVSTPSPGTPTTEAGPRRSSEGRPKSTADLSTAAEESRRRSTPHPDTTDRQPHGETSSKYHYQHQQQKYNDAQSGSASRIEDSLPSTSPGPRIDGPGQKQEVIKGPWRLLRLLPRESRNIIGAMLEIDPKKRATLVDMMQDPWITQTPVCRQEDRGVVINASNHEHTLEPGTAVSPAQTKH